MTTLLLWVSESYENDAGSPSDELIEMFSFVKSSGTGNPECESRPLAWALLRDPFRSG